jgi:hypothetical protein
MPVSTELYTRAAAEAELAELDARRAFVAQFLAELDAAEAQAMRQRAYEIAHKPCSWCFRADIATQWVRRGQQQTLPGDEWFCPDHRAVALLSGLSPEQWRAQLPAEARAVVEARRAAVELRQAVDAAARRADGADTRG